MTDAKKEPVPVPASVRAVGIVLAVAGGMFLLVGVLGLGASERSLALRAIGALALGAVCLALGWKMIQGRRWAYLGAAVVLLLAIVGGVITTISTGDRATLAQVFLPALGLYLLGRRESRDHFMV